MKYLIWQFVIGISLIQTNSLLQAFELKKIVVSEDRLEVDERHTGKNVSVITSEDIDRSGADSLIDLLGWHSGGFVSSGYTNIGLIDIRGQGESALNNVLVIVDGVILNSIDLSGVNIKSIDLDSVDKIEIIPAGSSVLYGDKAVGGVISITTKSKKNKPINIKLKTGSFGYNQALGTFQYRFLDVDWQTRFSLTRQDGYRNNSQSENQSGFMKGEYHFNKSHSIGLSTNWNQTKAELPSSLTKEQKKVNRKDSFFPTNWNETNSITSLDYQLLTDNLNVLNTISYRFKKSKMYQTRDYESIQESTQIKFNVSEKQKISTGLQTQFGKTKLAHVSQANQKDQAGVFLLDEVTLFDQVIMLGGIRYEFTQLNYASGHKKDYGAFLYSTGLNYLYSKTGNIYISFDNSYRTPAIDEYFQEGQPLFNTLDVYNVQLKPQRGDMYEVGIKENLFNTLIRLASFYHLIKHEIYFDSTQFQNQNYDGKTERYGIETSWKRTFYRFTFLQHYSYTQARILEGQYKNKQIPWVPRHLGGLNTSYEFLPLWSINTHLNYTGTMYPISDHLNLLPKVVDYGTIDVNLSFIDQNIVFNTGIKNLLNKDYNEFVVLTNVYPAPERQFYASFQLLF